jgi:hypothetical protein
VAIGPAFTGTFNEWFSDGSHFQTTVGTSVYTYTSASVKVDLTSLMTVQGLAGEGDYFWTVSAGALTIYTVGASTTRRWWSMEHPYTCRARLLPWAPALPVS